MQLKEKMFAVSCELGALVKSKKGVYDNLYVDLSVLLKQLNPILQKHKLLILSEVSTENESEYLTVKVCDIESGDELLSSKRLSASSNPQITGSELTYYRRYLLFGLFNVAVADDDGQFAADRSDEHRPITPKQRQFLYNMITERGLDLSKFKDKVHATNYNRILELVKKGQVPE